jgi:hypothetical protein
MDILFKNDQITRKDGIIIDYKEIKGNPWINGHFFNI